MSLNPYSCITLAYLQIKMQIFSKLEQHFTKQRGHEYVSLTVSDFIRMLPYGCVYWRVWALGKEGVFEQIFEIPDFFFAVAETNSSPLVVK